MHAKIQYFFILTLVPFFFFGQGTNERGFEIKSKIGFLAIHHQSMSHLPKETAKALEISYFQHTRGSKLWHKAYRYPTIGATLLLALSEIQRFLEYIQVFMDLQNYHLLNIENLS